jgi:hypothetical protein
MLSTAARGRFCDDFVITWAAHQVGIPIVPSSEILSYWRRNAANRERRYAITHPHKLSAC